MLRKTIIVLKKFIYHIFLRNIIIDVTGMTLTPGNEGKDCKGNGEHFNWRGKPIECCCDECDHYVICMMKKK